jgi:hypothetical protein
MKQSNLLTLVFGTLFWSGCVTEQAQHHDWPEMLRTELAKVHVQDGIDGEEANVLAKLYFWRVFGVCGNTSPDGMIEQNWRFHTNVGVAAIPCAPILVSKTDGKIVCADGPTVTDLQKLVEPDDGTFAGAAGRRIPTPKVVKSY